MNRIRMATVAGAAALLVLASAAPAMGAIRTGGMVQKTKDIVIAKGSTGGGKVACPTGYKATTGGGRWLPDGFSTGTEIVTGRSLGASLPTNNARRWYVSGANEDQAVDTATLRLRVTCLPSSTVGSTSTVTSWASPVSVPGYVRTTASCGSGRKVVSGGAAWQVQGDPLTHTLAEDHFLSSSSPRLTAGGWSASGHKAVAGGAQLKVVAICRSTSGIGTYQTKVKEIQGFNFPPLGVLAGGSATCPGSTRPVVGGAFWKNPFTEEVLDNGRLGSSSPEGKTGWYAAGAPSNNGVDRVLVLVLHCRPT